MKAPALVAVEQPPEAFAALFAEAAKRGVRVGWLDLGSDAEPPVSLAGAVEAGVVKAVAVSSRGALSWKRRTGAPVLRDLLREHFLGCPVVLLSGQLGTPRLAPDGEVFRLEVPGNVRRLAAGPLLDELLRPRHRA